MGLDIHLQTNLDNIDLASDTNFNKFSLSREFCNLMCRKHMVDYETEFDQISKIVDVDTSPIYAMETYPDDFDIEMSIEHANNEAEIEKIKIEAEQNKKNLIGNLDLVLKTINQLIDKLQHINNLPDLLIKTDFDTLDNSTYFSDFNINKGEGYIDNNFGQDLRNFKSFLIEAKAKKNTTVWFVYG